MPLVCLQSLGLPLRQYSQAPHQYPPPDPPRPSITLSPFCINFSAPVPSSSTIPMPSWPIGIGNGLTKLGQSPLTRCTSEWQTPAVVILTKASSYPGEGLGTSCTTNLPSAKRTARIFLHLLYIIELCSCSSGLNQFLVELSESKSKLNRWRNRCTTGASRTAIAIRKIIPENSA